MQTPIAAVLIYIPKRDHVEALNWYQKAFPQARKIKLSDFDFSYLDIEGVSLEIVTADQKVGVGVAGSVIYWSCADFQKRLDYLLSIGAKMFCGPLDIENNMRMCQVKDLWGNAIGIRGSKTDGQN